MYQLVTNVAWEAHHQLQDKQEEEESTNPQIQSDLFTQSSRTSTTPPGDLVCLLPFLFTFESLSSTARPSITYDLSEFVVYVVLSLGVFYKWMNLHMIYDLYTSISLCVLKCWHEDNNKEDQSTVKTTETIT